MNSPPEPQQGDWPPAPTGPRGPGGKRGTLTWQDHLSAAPREVVVFAVFAAIVCFVDLSLTFIGPKTWEAAVAPYTGRDTFFYFFSLTPACQILFTANNGPKVHQRMITLLVVVSAVGVLRYLTWPHHTSGNPSLTVSPWQPVWTVFLPLAWAIVLAVGAALRRTKAGAAG